ncbi:hypothetical protein GALMADRAFT_242998 [Galerina marginata CBS 339.88]|uniref:Uncharacterized protein n=1 Tax=Galerina marginata (strain CBS 339.88) TaxID=685588 RepID=A0A067T7F8_GALM3|nr:hypothetical protein GALMADRAFT_242998 [Galerina marginata CBS 339.88]
MAELNAGTSYPSIKVRWAVGAKPACHSSALGLVSTGNPNQQNGAPVAQKTTSRAPSLASAQHPPTDAGISPLEVVMWLAHPARRGSLSLNPTSRAGNGDRKSYDNGGRETPPSLVRRSATS